MKPKTHTQKLIMKTCERCKQTKSVDRFEEYKNNRERADGTIYTYSYRGKRCRECNDQLRKEREERKFGKQGRLNYIAKRSRKCNVKNMYGLEWKEYEALKELQDHKCEICKMEIQDYFETKNPPGDRGEIVIDHCHDTGRVRGLLCKTCNSGLGFFKDNPEFLRNAAAYIEKIKS